MLGLSSNCSRRHSRALCLLGNECHVGKLLILGLIVHFNVLDECSHHGHLFTWVGEGFDAGAEFIVVVPPLVDTGPSCCQFCQAGPNGCLPHLHHW